MPTGSMPILGTSRSELQEALADAFDVFELRALVDQELQLRLDRIVALPNRIDAIVLELVQYCERHGRLPDLIAAMVRAKPSHPRVVACGRTQGSAGSDAAPGGTAAHGNVANIKSGVPAGVMTGLVRFDSGAPSYAAPPAFASTPFASNAIASVFVLPGMGAAPARARERPGFDDLFEILRDPVDIERALYHSGPRGGLSPWELRHRNEREGMPDVQGALARAMTRSGGRLLLWGRAGIGKTREVAEYARNLAQRRWTICLARADSDSRLEEIPSIPLALRDQRCLIVVDDLHLRVMAFEDQVAPYLERFDRLLASLERLAPGAFRVVAATRSEPHYRRALGLAVGETRWRGFGTFELADFAVPELAEMLVETAREAAVPLEAGVAPELVENSDRTPETLLNNVDLAQREGRPLSPARWLPSENESWTERFELAAARFPGARSVLEAVRLFRRAGLTARDQLVRAVSGRIENADTTTAAEGLVDYGLLAARQGALFSFSEEQLRESLGGAGNAALAVSEWELLAKVFVEAAGVEDAVALAAALLRVRLPEPAELVAGRAVQLEHTSLEGRRVRAFARFLRGDMEGATADLDLVLANGSEESPPYALRASAHSLLGHFDEAIADIERALALGHDPSLVGGRAYIRFQRGELPEAEEDFDRAIEISPADPLLFFGRGVVRYQRLDFTGAEADFDACLRSGGDLNQRGLEGLAPGRELVRLLEANAERTGPPFGPGLVTLLRGASRLALGRAEDAEGDFDRALALGVGEELGRLRGALKESTWPALAKPRAAFTKLVSEGSTTGSVYAMRGAARLQRNDAGGAEADFTRALSEGCELAFVHAGRGVARFRSGRFAEAESDLSLALDHGHPDPEALALRGAARLERGELAGAEADLRGAIERGARDPWAHHWLGATLARLGRAEEAEESLSRALAEPNAPNAPHSHLIRGSVRLDHGKPAQAEEDFALAMRGGRDDALIHFLRGAARFQLERYPEAMVDLEGAIERGKRDAPTYSLHAAAAQILGRHAEAATSAAAAIATGRDDAWVHYVHGMALYHLQQHTDAEAALTRAIDRGPVDIDPYSGRAASRLDRGDHAGAVADYTAAMDHGRKDAAVWYWRGVARMEGDDIAGAEADFDLAEKAGFDRPELFYRRAHCRLSLHRHAAAIQDFTTVLDAGVIRAGSLAGRAHAHLALAQLPEALRDFDQSLALAADSAHVRNLRGLAHYAAGNLEAARADFEETAAHDPSNPGPRLSLAWIDLRRGDTAGAAAHAEAVVALVPDQADGLGARGFLAMIAGDWEGAHREFARAAEAANEEDWNFWRGLAALLAGRLAEARVAYAKGIATTVAGDVLIALAELDFWSAREHRRIAGTGAGLALEDIRRALRAHPGLLGHPGAERAAAGPEAD